MAKTPGEQLDSWKEIATYIRRDVRTAMRWAAHGMPVHRVPGSPRARVFAYTSEIDAWLAGTTVPAEDGDLNHSAASQSAAALRPARPWFALPRLWFVAALLAFAAGLSGWGVWHGHGGPPTSMRVEGSKLLVVDNAGRTVWERSYDQALAPIEGDPTVPRGQHASLEDVDADGNPEALFIAYPNQPGELESHRLLSCFGKAGGLKWEYSRKDPVRFGGTVYEPPFPVHFFLTTSLPGAKTRDIWVVSTHARWFPSVIAKLNSQGQVLGEYWHPGHVRLLAQAKLFGRPVMLVGATNNETNSADLTVLDYLSPSGHAPATIEDYKCINCPPGNPLAFLAFPRTEISQVLNARPFVKQIWPLADGGFEVSVLEGRVGDDEAAAQYSFDSDLRLQDAEVTDGYVFAFGKLLARDVVKHVLDRKAEADKLRRIRYWDGRRFRDDWAPTFVSEKR